MTIFLPYGGEIQVNPEDYDSTINRILGIRDQDIERGILESFQSPEMRVRARMEQLAQREDWRRYDQDQSCLDDIEDHFLSDLMDFLLLEFGGNNLRDDIDFEEFISTDDDDPNENTTNLRIPRTSFLPENHPCRIILPLVEKVKEAQRTRAESFRNAIQSHLYMNVENLVTEIFICIMILKHFMIIFEQVLINPSSFREPCF